MEWTNEAIVEFIDIYENEPVLWNTKTPEYKNRNDQLDAWSRVRSKLRDGNIPIKELKKKRDSLMSTYRKLRNKIKESMKTGSGAISAPILFRRYS